MEMASKAYISLQHFPNHPPVIELVAGAHTVLRRVETSSPYVVNATQILLLAGVADKTQRTRILEDKGLRWPHEKVQGGSVRFQGTWISKDNALQLAREYGVEKAIEQLVSFPDTSAPLPVVFDFFVTAPSAVPTVTASSKQQRVPVTTSNAPVKRKHADDTASHASSSTSVAKRSPRIPIFNSGEPSPASVFASISAPSAKIGADEDEKDDSSSGNTVDTDENANDPKPTAKRVSGGALPSLPLPSNFGLSLRREEQFRRPEISLVDKSKAFFLDLFLKPEGASVTLPSAIDVTVPLDANGNTSFHWAASLGRLATLQTLLSTCRDSNLAVLPRNFQGETCLMRAVRLQNCFASKNFKELLDLLKFDESNAGILDDKKQTIFHHAVNAAIPTISKKSPESLDICVYYLEIIQSHIGRRLDSSTIDAKDWNGNTATRVVRSKIFGGEKILTALEALGANINSLELFESTDESKVKKLEPGQTDNTPSNLPTILKGKRLQFDERTNPEFLKEVIETQNEAMNMLERLSSVYNESLLAQSSLMAEAQAQVDSLQTQIAVIRKQNKELRAQNVKISELSHRIGLADRGLEAEMRAEGELAVVSHGFTVNSLAETAEIDMNDAEALKGEVERLQELFARNEERGRQLAEEKTRLRVSGSGGEHSAQVMDMRKIIAFSCNVPLDQIDAYLEPILQALKTAAGTT
ncbi:transcriptional regulator swi6 [Entophlyctis luteolus]|nr:transcriptional regulator swi6 [Entophlyctis luteolus]